MMKRKTIVVQDFELAKIKKNYREWKIEKKIKNKNKNQNETKQNTKKKKKKPYEKVSKSYVHCLR